MGEKDLTEKILEDYNDVFADIFNTIIFKGQQRIQPMSLQDTGVHSQYRAADSALHELERDISKIWKEQNVALSICGIENQTKVEKYMPLRVIGYDGMSYRSQLLSSDIKPIPVVTLVLYFGTQKKWDEPTSLKELLDIPVGLDKYVNDYKMHVVNVAWMTEEQINMFQSDFGIVARFFCEKRKNKDYVPNDRKIIKHVDEVLKLLSVMTGDHRYEEILSYEGKDVTNMCDVAERLENKGRLEGLQEGLLEGRLVGRSEGQNDLVKAIQFLRNGKSDAEILQTGIDEKTLALAKTIR